MCTDISMKRQDPGLQPERTALAWTRTTLCFAVNAMLLTRLGMNHHSTLVIVTGLVLLGGTLALLMVALQRRQQFAGPAIYSAMRRHLPGICVVFSLVACGTGIAAMFCTHV